MKVAQTCQKTARLRHPASARCTIIAAGMNQDEPVRIPITDVFDLHTLRPQDVQEAVEAYLEEAHRLGLKALRIIHGRGVGVQRSRRWSQQSFSP